MQVFAERYGSSARVEDDTSPESVPRGLRQGAQTPEVARTDGGRDLHLDADDPSGRVLKDHIHFEGHNSRFGDSSAPNPTAKCAMHRGIKGVGKGADTVREGGTKHRINAT